MELRSDISKADLADALVLLLEKRPYGKISIQDMVDRAGLSRMAYYRNFDSKDAVLRYYVARITDRFVAESRVDFDALPLAEYMVVLFTHLRQWAPFCALLQRDGLLHFIQAEFDRIFLGKARTEAEGYRYSFAAGGLFNLFSRWLAGGCRESPEELAALFQGFLVGGQGLVKS